MVQSVIHTKEVVLIGYSGHAYVAYEIISAMGHTVVGYCEEEKKEIDPYGLTYLGSENELGSQCAEKDYFVAIGDNSIRKRVYGSIQEKCGESLTIIHPSSEISQTAILGQGIMVGAKACINAGARVGRGTICNTSSIIEHDCELGAFTHIAPGAILCGNVKVGGGTLIGAGAVVHPNIHIGANVVIGAGAVIIQHIPDHSTVVGNPGRIL